MSNNRLRYVEPTNFISSQEGSLSDSINFPYEDYNIAVELTVSKTDRYSCGWWTTDGGRKETVYSSNNGTISFLGGSKVGDDSYLTTNYTDISMSNPEGNTNECLGIESINITYNSWLYPQVTVKFIDVRGATVMLPAEKGYYNSDMVSNSSDIYKSLFSFPYPMFKLKVKGLYGKGATYLLAVEKTQFDFDSNTGNFNITVSFIGYMYRIYTDIPITYLTIAPYMKNGKEYWNEKIQSGEFVFRDVNGNKSTPMITIPDLKLKIAQVSNNQEVSSIAAEGAKVAESLDEQYETLSNIMNAFPFNGWFMPNSVKNVYKVFKTKGETETVADKIVEYVEAVSAYDTTYNTEHTKKIDSLVKIADKIKADGKEVFLETSSRLHFKALENGKGGTYTLDTNFFDSFVNKNIYGSSADEVYNNLVKPYKDVLEYIETDRNKLNDFYVLIFNRDGDYFDPKVFCGAVSAEQKTILARKEEESKYYKERHEGVIEKVLGFRPSIKNIYDLMFAHMDTFIHCFYASTKEIKRQLESDKIKRSKERYGIKNGDTDTEDVGCGLERAKYLPPYAAFYKDEYFSGQHKKTMMFPEDLKNGGELEEVKFVNELLNGAEIYIENLESVNNQIELMYNSGNTKVDTTFSNGGAPSFDISMFIPTTTFDFIYKDKYGNPYKNVATKIYTGDNSMGAEILTMFILRAFYYLNTAQKEWYEFVAKDAKAFGRIEAINLFKAVKDKYTDSFLKFISTYADGECEWFEKWALAESLDGSGVKDIVKAWDNNAVNLNKGLFSEQNGKYYYNYHKGFRITIDDLISGNITDVPCKVTAKNYIMFPLYFENISEMQKYYTEGRKMLSNSKMMPTSYDSVTYGGDGLDISTFVMYEARDYIKNIYIALKNEVAKSEEEAYGSRKNNEYGEIGGTESMFEAYDNNVKEEFNEKTYMFSVITSADGTEYSSNDVKKLIGSGSYEDQSKMFIKYPSIQIAPNGSDTGSIFYTNLYTDQTDIKAKAYLFLQTVPIMSNECGIDTESKNGLSLKVKLLREGSYYWREANPEAVKFVNELTYKDTNGKTKSLGKIKKPSKDQCLISQFSNKILRFFANITDGYCVKFPELDGGREYVKIKYPKGYTASRKRVLKKYFEEWATSTDEISGFAANEKRLTNKNLYSRYFNAKEKDEFENWYNNKLEKSFSETEKLIKKSYDEKKVLNDNDRRFTNGLDIVFLAGNNDNKSSVASEARKLQTFLRNLFFTVCTTLDLYNGVSDKDDGTMSVTPKNIKDAMKGFMGALNDIYGQTVTEYKEDSNAFQTKMAEAEANNPFNSVDLKISTYSTLKNLYDKWLSNPYNGPEDTWALKRTSASKSDFDNFKYVDSYYSDIGYVLLANVTKVSSWLNSSIPGPIVMSEGNMINSMGHSLYDYLTSIAEDCGGILMALPQKFGMESDDDIKKMFTPQSIDTEWDDDSSSFIFIYSYKPSQYLGDSSTSNVDMNGYSPTGDGIDLTDDMIIGQVFSNNSNSYTVPAFGVTYAKQNQSIFKNIQLSSQTYGESEASIAAKMNIASKSAEAPRETTLYGQDLYKVISNYSFNCSVETMGNTQIMPLMYFQLNNIPFWRGAYMIQKVSHNVVAGNMTTNFEGVRVNRYALPLSDGNLAIHKDTGGVSDGGTLNSGESSAYGGSSTGGETNVAGNMAVKIDGKDTIDFDINKITSRTPLICVTPAHGPRTQKKDEWEWSSNVVDRMVQILKSYKYSDGSPYQVQRCNKNGLHTGDGYSMKETMTLIKKLGSDKVVSLVPHWNGCGGKRHGVYVNKKSRVVRSDSRKFAECTVAVIKEFLDNKPSDLFNGFEEVKGMMDGGVQLHNLGEDNSDGAPNLNCACILTENWFADYPSAEKFKNRNNWPKLGWGWLTSPKGVETVAMLNAKGIKRYVDTLKDAPLTPTNIPSIPNSDYEAKVKALGCYVDIKTQDGCSDIVVEIKYATSHNCAGKNLYGNFNKAYVHTSIVNNIQKAHAHLKKKNYKLKIWDATRPNDAQAYAKNPDTNPLSHSLFGYPIKNVGKDGSFHIYGTAIDCTIVDSTGKELDMGTGMDAWISGDEWRNCKARCQNGGIGRFCNSDNKPVTSAKIEKYVETYFTAQKGFDDKRKAEVIKNRKLLFEALVTIGGLKCNTNEWWHFESKAYHSKPLM